MSVPAPATVNVPLLYAAAPGTAGGPTSVESQPDGSGAATLMSENVTVAGRDVLRLETASPTYTSVGMSIVSLSTTVQLTPLSDFDAVTVEPRRSSFIQIGTSPTADVVRLFPPILSRGGRAILLRGTKPRRGSAHR